jgi:deazaflavin-dependent oxidoreductase (nitroreductase family)
MSKKSLVSSSPEGLMRWLFRAPIFLYRIGLGCLLGERFVLLHHIGRKSGQMRQTVVEIIGHEQASDTYYIVSGWGYKAQWYQNLLATPTITIQVGRRKLVILAETLSPQKGAQILLDYRKKHPIAARELSSFMQIDIQNSSVTELENIVQDSLPIIALCPRN